MNIDLCAFLSKFALGRGSVLKRKGRSVLQNTCYGGG